MRAFECLKGRGIDNEIKPLPDGELSWIMWKTVSESQ